MRWKLKREDFGIKGEFGKDYILKGMPSIERRYENLEKMETEKGEKKTNKEKIWNLTVCYTWHEWNKLHRIGKIRYEFLKKLEKKSRETVKKRGKVEMWHPEKKCERNNWPRIGKMWWSPDREDNWWKMIGRNNVGKLEERTLEKKNQKNDQDDGKCEMYDIWKMIEEKSWKNESFICK